MVNNNKKAFTLAEMIMAMLIIAVASFAMLPILTKPKPQIDTVGVRGQFACYYENGVLKQAEYQERIQKEVKNAGVNGCELEFNQRPKNYLIIAIGAGSGSAPGQIKTKYASYVGKTASDKLIITVPRAYSSDSTFVSNGSSAELVAGSAAAINPNGLAGANIESCRLLTAGKSCSNYSNFTQVSCDSQYASSGSIGIICKNNNADENKNDILYQQELISVANLKKSNESNSTYTYQNYKLNVELKDSMYTLKSLQDGRQGEDKSMIEEILYKIHPQRKSNLITKFTTQKYGDKNKDGAVLILW